MTLGGGASVDPVNATDSRRRYQARLATERILPGSNDAIFKPVLNHKIINIDFPTLLVNFPCSIV
jgi:hypothetical protein